MFLFGFVVPLIVIFIASIVAHVLTKRFWRACLGVGCFSAIAYLSVPLVFGGFRQDVPFAELVGRVGAAALIAGIVGMIIAALVGVPFVLDRRLQERGRV